MLRKILSYGAIAGFIAGALLFGLTVAMKDHPPSSYGMVIGYLTMLIAFSMIFVAVKRHRDVDLGGVIRFWPAFGLGVGISLIASVFYVAAWEAALAVTRMDFGAVYADMLIEQQKAKGVTGDALTKFTAEMEQFKVEYANPLYRLPMTFTEIFPVGLIVSLLSAGLLRSRRFFAASRG